MHILARRAKTVIFYLSKTGNERTWHDSYVQTLWVVVESNGIVHLRVMHEDGSTSEYAFSGPFFVEWSE